MAGCSKTGSSAFSSAPATARAICRFRYAFLGVEHAMGTRAFVEKRTHGVVNAAIERRDAPCRDVRCPSSIPVNF
eukprot:scaffold426_cov319-Pavlova_lutheri.AAC.56